MPIDLRPPEQRIPRAVDCRSEEQKALDEKNEQLFIKCVCCSWYGAAVVLALGCALYVPVALVAGIFG